MSRKLRYAMVGGGEGAFIGAVHRHALALDGKYEFAAGALSSTPEKALRSGAALGLSQGRNYPTWQALLEGESVRPAGDRVDLVVIVTPNHVHYPVAKAFVEAGFHVACDKPLVHTSEQAEDLVAAVERAGTVFAVTYNYTGYPLVKEARDLVRSGAMGAVRKVVVTYQQGWLATAVEREGAKQAEWRTDPARSGAAGAIGDIGSHAENLAATVTGLELEAICADLTTFVPGRRLDDDGNLLLRFKGGARGVLIASQVAAGHENDLVLQVHGEKGSLSWRQEEPNRLVYAPLGEPERVLRRGNPYLGAAAQGATRLPSGHPEAFLEAFANVYAEVASAIHRHAASEGPAGDYPSVRDGARGVRFIERTVASSAGSAKWTVF
ncbi:MAG: Gfo/Idh/MocA family oxidoreductase [Trueperaceae bacterium]|nr:Gfo/Idh/MocA family oxidoreductase [Trueperaceae bacterium]